MLPIHRSTCRLAAAAAFLAASLPATAQLTIAVEQSKSFASDAAAAQRFGSAVATSGDRVLVGGRDGAVYVSVRDGAALIEEERLTPSVGGLGDAFGAGVAIAGDAAAVGAPASDVGGLDSGAVFAFSRMPAGWIEDAVVLASDTVAGDGFGGALAMDGDTLIVGADSADVNGADSGAAYVFRRIGGAWVEEAKLVAGDGTAGDRFGGAVAILGDTAVVGAAHDDEGGVDAGSAYVFERTGTTWVQTAELGPFAPQGGSRFGSSVAVGLYGFSVFVGSPQRDGEGAVFVFSKLDDPFVQTQKITPFAPGAGDEFGAALAADKSLVAIGAPGDDVGPNTDAGAVHVFRNIDTRLYEAPVALAPLDLSPGDRFGGAVAMQGDLLATGASLADDAGADAGAVYFHRVFARWLLLYCGSLPNSTGLPALITGDGTTAIAEDDLRLIAAPVPNQPGLFFFGPQVAQIPFGDGFLCVSSPVERLPVEFAVGGILEHRVDFQAPPAARAFVAGSIWNVQAWFRDPAAGGAGFNLSDAMKLLF